MKKSIILFCGLISVLVLVAFGLISWNSSNDGPNKLEATLKNEERILSDFIYDVGTRFSPIKKKNIDNATSIDAFFNSEQIKSMASLQLVSIVLIINDEQSDIREIGNSGKFNAEQLELLKKSDYTTNFLVRVDYQEINKATGQLEYSYATPHHTVVPEHQAIYARGKDALIEYLEENSKAARIESQINSEKLMPAKLFFTVTKDGLIENVRLDRSSNYPIVDKAMIELMTNAPGTWIPAKNTNGENVDQELVVSFGLMGC